MENVVEIMRNERSGKWSLWLNGKIIKMAAKPETLKAEAEKRGLKVDEVTN